MDWQYSEPGGYDYLVLDNGWRIELVFLQGAYVLRLTQGVHEEMQVLGSWTVEANARNAAIEFAARYCRAITIEGHKFTRFFLITSE